MACLHPKVDERVGQQPKEAYNAERMGTNYTEQEAREALGE